MVLGEDRRRRSWQASLLSPSGERLIASTGGATIAETVTLPIDTAKVRLQLQKSGARNIRQYKGMMDCMILIYKEEGATALFKGLGPALVRQICYTGLSFVLYEPIRDAMSGKGPDAGFMNRLIAGGTAGAIGITVMNPAEVIKTKMQGNTSSTSVRKLVVDVWSQEGIVGFWAGIRPNVTRTFLVCAAELGTYDQAKHMLISQGVFTDGPLAHLSASAIAGLASASTSTPADVVKTRLMNQAGQQHEVSQHSLYYRGMFHAFTSIFKNEGVGALYKGFVPVFWRKIVWCSSFFLSCESHTMNLFWRIMVDSR
ncbi:hypothetical protein GUITHDRAFT_65536 [Guillardia theta CCMP2712]|uniref:Uncharacterized protein n=1 Tax=Guillardia theta (strain CCMP2712) TaxID=905079 RepID=L1JTY2_GUITC|nr:hypothetical protein GUITHDRAFT_65536 [Guillardia theta CCMP2712]EKX52026.1 hypothetical protein GUITHDRAFT_65536 [Guillardia theta CCMP2712]|eukprot:XP_005839006.1 hypothetical protein GUITHDRAFT_65536 [Guillardia theta CCMP2712]